MPETTQVQHPPAVKVGGRRLSVSNKPKAHVAEAPANTTDVEQTVSVVDYPRPAPPGEDRPHPPPHHNDDDTSKKEKKHGQHDEKLKELAHNKVEATRPTRDAQGGGKTYGAGGRIAQPAGKGFGA